MVLSDFGGDNDEDAGDRLVPARLLENLQLDLGFYIVEDKFACGSLGCVHIFSYIFWMLLISHTCLR